MDGFERLRHTVASHHLAGHAGVEILAVLWPERAAEGQGRIALYDLAGSAREFSLEALRVLTPGTAVPRAALRDHALVMRPAGAFFSLDRLTLGGVRRHDDAWTIRLDVTRPESPNGEPAPRDLYVVLHLDLGPAPLRRLTLRFAGLYRDDQGRETPLAAPPAPDVVVEIGA